MDISWCDASFSSNTRHLFPWDGIPKNYQHLRSIKQHIEMIIIKITVNIYIFGPIKSKQHITKKKWTNFSITFTNAVYVILFNVLFIQICKPFIFIPCGIRWLSNNIRNFHSTSITRDCLDFKWSRQYISIDGLLVVNF